VLQIALRNMPQPVAVAAEAAQTKVVKRPGRRQGKQVHAH
jgi:hypothetical protein